MRLNTFIQKKDIIPTVPLIEWIIYEIVADVWDHPETDYIGVRARTCITTETVVNVLRWAEKHGYIEGHGGVYIKNGGGAKRWRALKMPHYPYRFLSDNKIYYTIVAHVGDYRIPQVNVLGHVGNINIARQIIKTIKPRRGYKKIHCGVWIEYQPKRLELF